MKMRVRKVAAPGFLFFTKRDATTKHHTVAVTITCLDAQTEGDAADRVKRWLETFGHTAAGHGFEFKSVLVPEHASTCPMCGS